MMPSNWKARVPEEEFIQMCRTMRVADIAVVLKMDRAKVYERKRNIEKRTGLSLSRDADPEDSAICSIQIQDGVVLVGGDAHYWPNHVPTMHKALLYLCKRLNPVVVVANGDLFDGARISRFSPIQWQQAPDVQKELEAVQDRLDELLMASPNAAHYRTVGNHDMRFESRLASVASEFRNVKGTRLRDHLPGWQPCWAVEVNRDTPTWTEIRHREKGGQHASYRNTVEAGVTMVTNHDHRADVVPYTDRRGMRYGVRTGMIAETPLDPQFVYYLEGKRNNWQSAVGVLTYKDGRLLQPELCLRHDYNLVEFRGELIALDPNHALCDYDSEQTIKARAKKRKA